MYTYVIICVYAYIYIYIVSGKLFSPKRHLLLFSQSAGDKHGFSRALASQQPPRGALYMRVSCSHAYTTPYYTISYCNILYYTVTH